MLETHITATDIKLTYLIGEKKPLEKIITIYVCISYAYSKRPSIPEQRDIKLYMLVNTQKKHPMFRLPI